jgi:hypothetical protein
MVVGDETVELAAGQHAFGPRDVPHRFTVGPDGARMIWVLTPGGFENLVEAASVPAEAPTVPPPSVAPPEDVAEIVRRHGNEVLPVEPRRGGGGPHRGRPAPPSRGPLAARVLALLLRGTLRESGRRCPSRLQVVRWESAGRLGESSRFDAKQEPNAPIHVTRRVQNGRGSS